MISLNYIDSVDRHDTVVDIWPVSKTSPALIDVAGRAVTSIK